MALKRYFYSLGMKISYLTYFFQFLHITNLTIGIKSSTVFWRTDGVKMEATAIEVTNYVAAEQCLAGAQF